MKNASFVSNGVSHCGKTSWESFMISRREYVVFGIKMKA